VATIHSTRTTYGSYRRAISRNEKSTILFEETTLASKPGVTLDGIERTGKEAYVIQNVKLLYIMK
jgi:hypothetical protein